MSTSTPASIFRCAALLATLLYLLWSADGWAQSPAASGQTTPPPPLELPGWIRAVASYARPQSARAPSTGG